jgi:polyhydroxyalkanoate synthase
MQENALQTSKPAALLDDYSQAWMDWLSAVVHSPDRPAQLAQSAAQKWQDTASYALQAAGLTATSDAALPHGNRDRQFADPAWNQWPFNAYARAYGNWVGWWNEALQSKESLPTDRALRVEFAARQALAAGSPANYLGTNPELLQQTWNEQGANLWRGTIHWLEDMQRTLEKTPAPGADQFKVGEAVAVTPGKVVFRNDLLELIQYSPQTPNVHAEPVLIVPAWIMKYYILDLSPKNSLIRYLVEQGHTVFAISWKNPTAADRNLGMDDYVLRGFDAALDQVTAIVPDRRVQAVGYCIGGTLLSIAAARLAAAGDQRIGSMTLFAAQTDFSEPGELSVFITPAQLAALDQVMQQTGVLTSEQMGMSFALLRSADLVWAPAINTYLRGKRDPLNDLMAWNADGTRMPCRMHSEYLSRLYLRNELSGGQFTVAGKTVDLKAIDVPMFVVGTETDHVAPWRSVYKVSGLTHGDDFTFLLTSGGHNAGIISGPVHPKRTHRVLTSLEPADRVSADEYVERAEKRPGSWWPTWQQWLVDHSQARRVKPPVLADGIADAPGQYVLG